MGQNSFNNEGISNKYWKGINENSGKECIEGTYFFTAKFHLKNGKEFSKTGNITLLK